MALGALDAARHELKLDVPGDVSVVGFDDISSAAWPSYNLTTMRQPIPDMVAGAVDLLLDRVENSVDRVEVRVFKGQLVDRGSARFLSAGPR